MAGFWRRHRRKIFITVGVLGCGYALYRLYDEGRRRSIEDESEAEGKKRADEIIRAQLRNHFEGIQKISETTTLPYAMQYLRSRVADALDLSHITEKLMQGKGQPNALQSKEKLELWERLKVLSFARMATSLWTMTTLFLYVQVQVNILGRHVYLEAARDLSFIESDEPGQIVRQSQKDFLATADYLCTHGIGSLIYNMQHVAAEVTKSKPLRGAFDMTQLRETILQILASFMNGDAPWIMHVLPEGAEAYRELLASSSSNYYCSFPSSTSKLEELIAEARLVLLSEEFRKVMDLSMAKVLDGLIDDLDILFGGAITLEIPLAKFLPRIVQLAPSLLEDPTSNRYIAIIRGLPEVELYYRILYANTAQN